VKKNHSAPSGNGGGTSPFFFFNATIIQNNDRCRHREPASLYMTRRVVLGHVGSMVDISTGCVNRNHLKQHLQTPEGFPRISSATVLRWLGKAWKWIRKLKKPSHTCGSQRSRVLPKPWKNDAFNYSNCVFGTKWSKCRICWVFSRLQIGWDVLVESWEPNHWRQGGGQQSKLPMPATFDDIDIIDIVIFNYS
jgi:hypothetical protein